MFSNPYRNDIRVNDTVATVLDMGDENEHNEGNNGCMPERNEAPIPNVATNIVVNTTDPIDDED